MTRTQRDMALSGAAAIILAVVTTWLDNWKVSIVSFLSLVIGFLVPLSLSIYFALKDMASDLKTSTSIGDIPNAILRKLAREAFSARSVQLEDAVAGRMKLASDEEMMRAYYNVVKAEGSTIDATSMVADTVWLRARGTQAFKMNEEALSRGVKIRRVFIVPANGVPEGLRKHIEEQAAAGIDARCVAGTALNSGMHRDFLVTKGGVSLDFELDDDGVVFCAVLDCNAATTERNQRAFDEIWSVAKAATQ